MGVTNHATAVSRIRCVAKASESSSGGTPQAPIVSCRAAGSLRPGARRRGRWRALGGAAARRPARCLSTRSALLRGAAAPLAARRAATARRRLRRHPRPSARSSSAHGTRRTPASCARRCRRDPSASSRAVPVAQQEPDQQRDVRVVTAHERDGLAQLGRLVERPSPAARCARRTPSARSASCVP